MQFTPEELKVIKYSVEWMNNPDTFQHDHECYPEIWKTSFGSLELQVVLDTHKELLTKLSSI